MTAAPTRHRPGPLHGKSVLVTGSSRGLGCLIARELADRGCRVMRCARGCSELEPVRQQLADRGADVHALACNRAAPW